MKVELNALPPQACRRLTDEEFRFCYERVPCLCLDFVIAEGGRGILFAKRTIEPFKGYYTLPGGIWRYKEPINEACDRLLDAELGIVCLDRELIGQIHHIDDGEFRSSVSLVYLINKYKGILCGSEQGKELAYLCNFSQPNIQPYQAAFFRDWAEELDLF